MTVERHFIGWHRPVVHQLAELLFQGLGQGVPDLRDVWVVVPTSHAGRRLRERLATLAAQQGRALLPPRVVTPEQLLAAGPLERAVADRYQMLAVWVQLLRKVPDELFETVFSTSREHRDFGWYLSAANRLVALKDALGENGLTIAEVQETLASLDRPERWDGLARLEQVYLEYLDSEGLADRNATRKACSIAPLIAGEARRIIMAGVPDPLPLALAALENVSSTVPVEVYVHAPAQLARAFDLWGRPVPQFWTDRRLPVPHEAISLCASPAGQARLAVELMHSRSVAPSDTAFGVPDAGVTPFLEGELARNNLTGFNPAGESLGDHRFVHLLALFSQLALDPAFEAFSALARHPDWLDCASRECGVGPAALLEMLDNLQARSLPGTVKELKAGVSRHPGRAARLAGALSLLERQLDTFSSGSFGQGILAFLSSVYEGQTVNRQIPEQRRIASAAAEISKLATRFEDPLYERLGITPAERMSLFRSALGLLGFYPERAPGAVDLLGWLELHWDDAPFLVITGMNEGLVPDSIVGDPFLPDSARTRLGLKNNEMRAARDAYLLEAMWMSRQESGETCILLGKTSNSGDPLKPSRLLFQCVDDLLPARVARLFGQANVVEDAIPRTLTWKLRPRLVTAPESLSVTSLKGYLQCPFRFYLSTVLGMEAVDDTRQELDALQFGSAAHNALEAYAADPGMRESTRVPRVAAFLHEQVDYWFGRQFGPDLSAALLIQREALYQRLSAAAFHLVEQRRLGWSIERWEMPVEATLEGVTLRGKVDRVDRHASGMLRVLDYKTSDRSNDPRSSHLKRCTGDEPEWMLVRIDGKTFAWSDLQLPLYVWMVEKILGSEAVCGYFHLPKAVTRTGVQEWGLLDDGVLESAVGCATAVCRLIREGRFWPPADKVDFDGFGALFFGTALESVQWEVDE